MDSNTYSTQPPGPLPDDLADLAAAVDKLAGQDRQGLAGTVRALRVLAGRELLDR